MREVSRILSGIIIAVLLLLVIALIFVLWVVTVCALTFLKLAHNRLGDDAFDDAEMRVCQKWAMEALSKRFRRKR